MYLFIFCIFSSMVFSERAALFLSSAKAAPSQQSLLSLENFFKGKWKLNQSSLSYLNKGQVLAEADVGSKENNQSFSLNAAGWHNKKCSIVLRKLSMLENYAQWISFVKSSEYHERGKLFTLRADHALLPYPMIVHIIMERPTKPGRYNFTFPTGIFKGLSGHYIIEEREKRCLIYATSSWSGKETGIPNLVIELFVEGLTKKAAEFLIRKTQF